MRTLRPGFGVGLEGLSRSRRRRSRPSNFMGEEKISSWSLGASISGLESGERS